MTDDQDLGCQDDPTSPYRGDANLPGASPLVGVPEPAFLEYEPAPVRLRGRAWWRWWYGKGRAGSFLGSHSLWASMMGGVLLVVVGLVNRRPDMAVCMLVPLAILAAVCGLAGLVQRDTDKFFPLAGLTLLVCGSALWWVLTELFYLV